MFKNVHFTLLIRISRQLHEFNFRKRTPELYDTDTGDERGNRYYFKMIKEGNEWKIHGRNLPTWIVENELTIADALRQKENA